MNKNNIEIFDEDVENDSFLMRHYSPIKEPKDESINREWRKYIEQAMEIFFEYIQEQNGFKLLRMDRLLGLPTMLLEKDRIRLLLLMRVVVNDIVLRGDMDKDFLKANPNVHKNALLNQAEEDNAVPVVCFLELFPFPDNPNDERILPSELVHFKAAPCHTNYFLSPAAYVPQKGSEREEVFLEDSLSSGALQEDKSMADFADALDVIGHRNRYNDISEEYLYNFAFDYFKKCIISNDYKDLGHLTLVGIPFFLLEINKNRIIVAVKPNYRGRGSRSKDQRIFEELKAAAIKHKALPMISPITLYDFDDYLLADGKEIVAIDDRLFWADRPTMIHIFEEIDQGN